MGFLETRRGEIHRLAEALRPKAPKSFLPLPPAAPPKKGAPVLAPAQLFTTNRVPAGLPVRPSAASALALKGAGLVARARVSQLGQANACKPPKSKA